MKLGFDAGIVTSLGPEPEPHPEGFIKHVVGPQWELSRIVMKWEIYIVFDGVELYYIVYEVVTGLETNWIYVLQSLYCITCQFG